MNYLHSDTSLRFEQSFKSNRKEWVSFSDHVQIQAATVIRALSDGSSSTTDAGNGLLSLKMCVFTC